MDAMTELSPPAALFLSGDEAFALEAQILEQVSSGQSHFQMAIWETERCLVVPQSFTRNERFEAAATQSKAEGWPIFTRCTGGDVTPQGPGTMNVTLAYRLSSQAVPSIDEHYDLLCRPISDHLQSWGLVPEFSAIEHSFCDGAHNLSVDGRKMVGTAQRWRRVRDGSGVQMVFAHALILVDADISGGIAAMNTLYESCDLKHRIRENVHINLSEVAVIAQTAKFSTSTFSAYLGQAYNQLFKHCR